MYVSKSITFQTPHIGHSGHGLFFYKTGLLVIIATVITNSKKDKKKQAINPKITIFKILYKPY
jgi:hypothetical protein